MAADLIGHITIKDPRKWAADRDPAALRRWFDSPAYQALIPLREQAAEVTLVGYEA
jgi:hypothetical protein